MLNSIFACLGDSFFGYSKRKDLAFIFLNAYESHVSFFLDYKALSIYCNKIFYFFASETIKRIGFPRYIRRNPRHYGLKLFADQLLRLQDNK
jgi:hypothetical protein